MITLLPLCHAMQVHRRLRAAGQGVGVDPATTSYVCPVRPSSLPDRGHRTLSHCLHLHSAFSPDGDSEPQQTEKGKDVTCSSCCRCAVLSTRSSLFFTLSLYPKPRAQVWPAVIATHVDTTHLPHETPT